MRMLKNLKAPVACATAVLALGACDILDVSNPNNLVEEDIEQEAAASAVANGALRLSANAISGIWQPYLVASDEMFWIGSRDAWLQLDQGFVGNPDNEFTDGFFPNVGQARWMGDKAIEILEGHVADNPDNDSFKTDLARAYLFSGMMYMVIGEVQEDFAFSDKIEAGPPVGPDQMFTVLDDAIDKLSTAVTLARELGDSDLEMRALALRARAYHSRAIWDKLNPTASGSDPLVSSSMAAADANSVISMAGGVGADWSYELTYSSSSTDNDMAAWINDRKENQFDQTLVTLSADNDVTGVALMDPIDGIEDPVVTWKMNKWKGGDLANPGNSYPPLDITSTRLMHLILAEEALAGGDETGFATHINHVRAMDGLSDYEGQIPAIQILEHERRVNLLIMGLRLGDMYRFGTQDPDWESASDAVQTPGEMLPITITEIRANCYLNDQTCPGGGG
ncbi:MAG: hypothetical protein PVI57_12320 [Gemmatimonadota bacterium]